MEQKQLKIEILNRILNQQGSNENKIQKAFESHPELIPLPFLLNHRLHFNTIFKKFPLPNGQISDFMYLTKSSDEWWVVFIELESSNKRIFNKAGMQRQVHSSAFNNSYDQIIGWKAYLEKNSNVFKESIKPLMFHMADNAIRFKFLLVIGRSNETLDQNRKDLLLQKKTSDIKVMTYDSAIRFFENNPIDKKIVASKTVNGYRLLNLNNPETALFAHLNYGNLFFDPKIKKQLIKLGYNIKAWEGGQLLGLNNKQPIDLTNITGLGSPR